jgi:hypothetical protein
MRHFSWRLSTITDAQMIPEAHLSGQPFTSGLVDVQKVTLGIVGELLAHVLVGFMDAILYVDDLGLVIVWWMRAIHG